MAKYTRKNYLELFRDGLPVIASGRSSNRHTSLHEAGEHAEQHAREINEAGDYEVRVDGGLYYMVRITELTLDATLDDEPPAPPEANAEFSLNAAQYSGNENTVIQFTILRTVRTDQVCDVDWAVTNASVLPLSGTERFQLGESQKVVSVTAQEVDTTEFGSITLSNPVYISGPVSTPIIGSPGSASITVFDTDAELTDQQLRDLGYVLLDDYPNVDPTGIVPVPNASWYAAVEEANENNKALWLSRGATYLFDETKVFAQWHPDTPSGYSMLHGGGDPANDTTWPLIKLKDNTYTNPGSPRPALAIRAWGAAGSVCDGTPGYPPDEGAWPSDPMDNTCPWTGGAANLFYCSVINIRIDCGNNAGAYGLHSPMAQRCYLAHIHIDASNAFSGIRGLPGRNSPIIDLKVSGGVEPVFSGNVQTREGQAGGLIAGLELVCDSRTTKPIQVTDFVPTTIVGFKITTVNNNPIWVSDGSSDSFSGCVALIDGQIETNGGTVFDNANGHSCHIRNVYVKGTDNLIQSGSEALITELGTWKRIDEYSYCDQRAESGNSYEHFNFINGVINRTPEAIISKSGSVAAPSVDYVARHIIHTPKADSVGTFANIDDFGATKQTQTWGKSMFVHPVSGQDNVPGALDDTTADSWQAIEDAIAAAELAGHNNVVVPRGVYYISQPIQMRKDTCFIGIGGASTIVPKWAWKPTSQVWLVESADDAAGTAHYSNIRLYARQKDGDFATGTPGNAGPYEFDWFSFVRWRTGKNSSSIQFLIERQFQAATNRTQPKNMYTFEGNAGGKHYSPTVSNGRNFGNFDSRAIKITNTSQPLHLYGGNVELASKGAINPKANVEVRDSSNVRIYACKREGDSSTCWLINVTNFAWYGMGRQSMKASDHEPGGIDGLLRIEGDSDKVTFAPCFMDGTSFPTENQDTVQQALTGQSEITLAWPNGLAIYKLGELDDVAVTI